MEAKKNLIRLWFVVLGLSALAFFLSFAYTLGQPEIRTEHLIFATVGLNQRTLPNENSSYEIQRAAEHFSNVILGWTVEPSFESELEDKFFVDLSVSGRRQEKENLLFTVSSVEPLESHDVLVEAFLTALRIRLNEYNAATQSGYTLAMVRSSELEIESQPWRFTLGLTLITFLASTVFSFVFRQIVVHKN